MNVLQSLPILLALTSAAPAADDLALPPGFEATVFHPGIGLARHIAVRDSGDVFVARRFALDRPQLGISAAEGALVVLRDDDGDGVADRVETFGPTDVGTGLEIHGGYVYFSSDIAVYRIQLGEALVPTGLPEPIAGGFPMQRSHASKSIALDREGNLYVNSGAPSNACQTQPRKPGSPGMDPCPQLERSGGIWRFAADKLHQDQLRAGELFVTGIRNVVALEWNPAVNQLFFAMHGRDSLDILWPENFTAEQRAEVPAEEFHVAQPGDDFGWPYTYWDPERNARMQSPEYGGDGEALAQGDYKAPLIGFPAHWGPNDLIFHSGKNFPARYRGGAFIAFHGSWNRAPFPQGGYKVVFVPLRDGRPTGAWDVFADGFTGKDSIMNPGEAKYRPTGLAEGPDGALYVTDSRRGRIWRITYGGD
jgi:glucose/arabinose dehydrogenase